MKLKFSIIIPVYNRPIEIDELLQSLTKQTYLDTFEVVIVEDGSEQKSENIVTKYKDQLQLKYLSKPNTGAGLSRNLGMKNALGNYYIILDSDVILPPTYIETVAKNLQTNFTNAFGGPDAAHTSFNTLQKAINYSMTSMLTSGGLRGNKKAREKFQLRSFNMGISKKAFKITNGFSKRKIGEDIDLSFRLLKHGFKTQLIPDAYVYHKRRTSIFQFFKQTYRFGKERPILNKQYPNTGKLTYWFPSIFSLGLLVAIFSLLFSNFYAPFLLQIYYLPSLVISFYLLAILIDSSLKNKSIIIGLTSLLTTFIQFFGYGIGFFQSWLRLRILKN